jgi:hypothetical protein
MTIKRLWKVLVVVLVAFVALLTVMRLTRPTSQELKNYLESQHLGSSFIFPRCDVGIRNWPELFYAEYLVFDVWDRSNNAVTNTEKHNRYYIGVLGHFYVEKHPPTRWLVGGCFSNGPIPEIAPKEHE